MSQKSNRLVGAVVAIVAVLGVILGIVLAKPAAPLDPTTPEGVVQSYLNAALQRDNATALKYLDPASGCKISSFDNVWIPDNAEVQLVKSSTDGSTAVVDVKVTYGSTDMLGTSGSEAHTYRLNKVTDGWLIANMAWPLYDCGLGK